MTADADYFSDDTVRAAEALGAEPYIAVGAHRRDGRPDAGVYKHRTIEDAKALRGQWEEANLLAHQEWMRATRPA